jgi:LPS O-antigen subunit length determinant protein (WzzB/FepE family)
MEQDSQKENTYQESEFDLLKLINNLLARKLLIFGLTSIITLLSIIYSLNLTPTYKVTSTFISTSDLSMINVNKLELTSKSKESIFSNFLTTLSSREFQKKSFMMVAI